MADVVAGKSGEGAAGGNVTAASTTHSKRFMEGPLSKWTNVVNGWQYRWFVLDQSAGLLSYYTVSEALRCYVCSAGKLRTASIVNVRKTIRN